MNMEFFRKLPIPKEIKEQYPLPNEFVSLKEARDKEIKDVLSGKSDKFIIVVGPCSADNESSVLDYVSRLKKVDEKVSDKLIIIPRVYTNKPRTTGDGYKGMLHQPNPEERPDMLNGLIASRSLHIKVISETGFTCADEMLYPDNFRYESDILSYTVVGARSVENQQHRLTSSGLDIPVGMKNPTSGNLSVMLNSINAAQHSHTFIYRGWEVMSHGNDYAHAVLRGYVDKYGVNHPNYHYEDLITLYSEYEKHNLNNPAVLIDTNHDNSGKDYLSQIRISKEVLHSMKLSDDIHKFIKGLIIESYIEDGCQKIGDNVYGKSITDPCLGWDKTERLIYEIADKL